MTKMDAGTAMHQAEGTAALYFTEAVKVIQRQCPNASPDAKAIASSNLAIAAALDYLAAELGGRIQK